MSKIKFKEIENFELNDIQTQIIEIKKQLFELRIKKGTRQTFKPHLYKYNQHRLKQLIFLQYKKILDTKNS